ncbi:MAG: S53 family peptidase [Ktedonobacteraceae bacterium]
MHKKIQRDRQYHLSIVLLSSVLLLLLSACSVGSGGTGSTTTPTPRPTAKPTLAATSNPALDTCPAYLSPYKNCFTPHALRVAYGVEPLTERGSTGKGMTVIDIVSYGSPTLQQDMDVFDKQFGLPPITIQVVAPLGTVPFNANDANMTGWAQETELDVQIIHAIAPDAGIVVMTSPVAETEGTIGLPQFMQLEQYAVNHHLGQVFSQSYVASEATLADSAGQQFVQSYANFYKQITTQDGFTVVTGSGDNGATDWQNIAATQLAPHPTVNFPADVPWVTAVGGTTLTHSASGSGYEERAWSGSGGGMSTFFSEPDYQRDMPQAVQSELAGHRGIPDIAADADPYTGMAFYFNGQWTQTGGTSASTPFWAAIVAIADQMAGHPLGFINPGIYKVAASQNYTQDFRDITAGSNSVAKVSVQGFQAVKGWDAVTGWGSPQANTFIPDLIAALK